MHPDPIEILDRLPEKPPRSRLESYADFIKELRRRKRTYREIAQILEEQFQLHVSKSTVHRFLQVRSPCQRRRESSTEINLPVVGSTTQEMDEVWRRMGELKQQSIPSEMPDKEFRYDREEPLHLIPNAERKESSDG
jgi:hypothetical protein